MVQQSNPGTVTGGRTGEYVSPASGGPGGATPEVEVVNAFVAPTDRVRWGPILAGLFTTLSALAILGLLGLAIGLSAFNPYNPGDRSRAFGVGAGIWGLLSTIVAFALGGCVAGWASAVRGSRYGLVNGAMVGIVAIPLMVGALAGGAASLASTAATASDNAATAIVRTDASGQTVVVDRTPSPSGSVTGTASTGAAPDDATRTARRAAWGMVITLLISLAAAAVGGQFGARPVDSDRDRAAT